MVDAREGHSNAYGVFLSPGDWWTLAGGNTPGNRPAALRPGGVLEITAGYPIRPIGPICRILFHRGPQTHPHPKSTLDLGSERLIKVENGLRSPLSLTCYRPISGPKIRESNQNQTTANHKIYSVSPFFLPRPTKSFMSKLTSIFAILF